MLGKKVTSNILFYYWDICWVFVTPAMLVALIVLNFITIQPLQLNGYTFPNWSNIFAQILTASGLFGVVIWAVYLVIDALFVNKRVSAQKFEKSYEFI